MIFGQSVEDDGRDREVLVTNVFDIGMERQQTMLTVNRPQDAFPLRYFQPTDRRAAFDRLECQFFVAGDDHGARNRRQIASLAALFVILHEFVDLSPDDLALVRLLAGRNSTLEQVPVHF
jgi:hypothetical protein